MMTPFPVPIHRRLHDIIRVVILTNEKPSLPVPMRRKKAKFKSKFRQANACLNIGFVKTCGTLSDGLTQHLADVGFDVDILEVLKGVSVEQSESGVQSDGHPDAIAMPGQLTDLAVLTRVGVKRLLQFK